MLDVLFPFTGEDEDAADAASSAASSEVSTEGSLQEPPPPPGPSSGGKAMVPLGAGLVGAVLDVIYSEPEATYRVRVVKYDEDNRWHKVDSEGLSDWDGESFTDTIDVNSMAAQGRIRFVEVPMPTLFSDQPRGRGKAPRG
eukprot:CAMPEP_0175758760 /NCGR_PEP_ID=MMETSP0097-20121207/65189_1 /TAXON_ID=311494 /ORGANISM="Alexandrium monilatum, Strain CCMP3105" /LENGTH=140 /DNA_ID=CAMNT_0017068071 /DNA_START=39 /DNA_END=458 /DNA_ORIENTATION=+